MPEEIQQKLIEEEMKQSYLDYAMSVIVGRALPDVKDGLKPVHRRVLYAMHDLSMLHNKPHKKSARIVGEVLGKYHPHGDQAVYDSLVRMAQEFSLRYPLIDGQGNFGSIDGDNAASMRYTEARLSKISEELLKDIEKNTVSFTPNFDNSLKEPTVLPAKLPNLLINGSSGIAVGMATNIPPHNIQEICNGIIATVNNPEITTEELISYIKGPDFPTSGLILGRLGILQAYKTGRGKITLRAKTEIKDNKIIITEIPYMINKASLIEYIADLVRDKKIEGITDIRDESDRKGLTIVIETRKSSNREVILNQLFKLTSLQTSFGIIMLALHDSQPKIMNLNQIINYYIEHRKEIVTKRTQFDLDKAEKRMHIIEGLLIALSNIDKVINLIKKSKDPLIAKTSLMDNYSLTEIQSQAILDIRLQRLTSLEQNKIKEERKSLEKLIEELKFILASEQKILDIIKQELIELKETYKDERRTQILDVEEEIETEDLIEEDDIVITSTYSGYIKQTYLEEYKQQRRGGQGIQATKTKEEDVIEHLFICNNHNYLLFFTNKGNIHWLKAFKIPSGSRYSRGSSIVNLLKLDKDEKVNTILPITKFEEDLYLLFCTKKGILKKTKLESYSHPRKGGIKAIKLKDKDELVTVRLTPDTLDMILATKKGTAVKFNEQDVRVIGRNASGVKGIKLKKDDEVIGLEVALQSASLLTVTEKGFGKRTSIDKYRLIKRGGSGVKNIKITEKNGNVIGIKTVKDKDEIMLISKNGIIIRVPVDNISIIGRSTQGVRIMKLKDKDKVVTLARVIRNNN